MSVPANIRQSLVLKSINKIPGSSNAGLGMKSKYLKPIQTALSGGSKKKDATSFETALGDESNPFRRNAMLRFAKNQGVPFTPQQEKTSAFNPMGIIKGIGTGLNAAKGWLGNNVGLFTSPNMNRKAFDVFSKLKGGTKAIQGLRSAFNPYSAAAKGTSGFIGMMGRGALGSYIGSQIDQSDSGYGSIIGGIAGVAAPGLTRGLASIGGKAAPGTVRSLLQNPMVAQRMFNEPAVRAGMSMLGGKIIDSGAGLAGYDTNGWGQRIGAGLGIAGGLRPAASLISAASPTAAKGLSRLGNTWLGKQISAGSTGGWADMRSWLTGTPAATGGLLTATAVPMIAEGVKGQIDSLAEKKKAITDIMQKMPGGGQGMAQFENMLKQTYGPQARLFDMNGTPSMQAIQMAGQMGQKAMGTMQQMGQNYFGNSQYLFDPNNWNKLSTPTGAISQMLGANLPLGFANMFG
jgi:hypothetical protein